MRAKSPISDASAKLCVQACAIASGADYAAVVSRCRKQRLIVVRAAAAIILRERGLSLKRIGRHLGFRHHWAVINYLRRADREPNKILPIVERARDFVARVERLRNESR